MTTYYVLTNINSYETGAYKHDNLKDALEDYKQKLGYTNPVLVQQLEVKITATPAETEPITISMDNEEPRP